MTCEIIFHIFLVVEFHVYLVITTWFSHIGFTCHNGGPVFKLKVLRLLIIVLICLFFLLVGARNLFVTETILLLWRIIEGILGL